MPVKILVTRISLIIFRTTKVIGVPCRTCKSFKSHRAIVRPVEESGVISFFAQLPAYTGYRVQRRWCQKERFYKHRDTRQYGRHSVDTLHTIRE